MISGELFKKHIIQQALFPTPDGEQWKAYLVLSQIYPNLTYWSMDGYSCDALADYSKDIVWDRTSVYEWTTKKVLLSVEKEFWSCSTAEIVEVWTRVNGETTMTKRRLINSELVCI